MVKLRTKNSIKLFAVVFVLVLLIPSLNAEGRGGATVSLSGPSSASQNSYMTVYVSISGIFIAGPGNIQQKIGSTWTNVKSFSVSSSSITVTGVPTGSSTGSQQFRANIVAVGISNVIYVTINAPNPPVTLSLVSSVTSTLYDQNFDVTVTTGGGNHGTLAGQEVQYKDANGIWQLFASWYTGGSSYGSFTVDGSIDSNDFNNAANVEFRAKAYVQFTGWVYSPSVYVSADYPATSITVTAPQISLEKGDTIAMTMTLQNSGASATVSYTYKITNTNYDDFEIIVSGTKLVDYNSVEYVVFYAGEGSWTDGTDYFAFNIGVYTLEVLIGGVSSLVDTTAITITNANDVVFVVAFEDTDYLSTMGYTGTDKQFLNEAVGTTSFIEGDTQAYTSEQIFGVDFKFTVIQGYDGNSNDFNGYLQIDASTVLNLGRNWTWSTDTSPKNHGFDILMGLTAENDGGVTTTLWDPTTVGNNEGNLMTNGIFDGDKSILRTKIIVVHELGHAFGAIHLDDPRAPVGPFNPPYTKGYVMYEGTDSQEYEYGQFLWHPDSISIMNINTRFT